MSLFPQKGGKSLPFLLTEEVGREGGSLLFHVPVRKKRNPSLPLYQGGAWVRAWEKGKKKGSAIPPSRRKSRGKRGGWPGEDLRGGNSRWEKKSPHWETRRDLRKRGVSFFERARCEKGRDVFCMRRKGLLPWSGNLQEKGKGVFLSARDRKKKEPTER